MRSSIEPSLSPPGLYTDVPSTLSEEITSLDVVVVAMSTPPINECDTFMLETRGHQYQSPASIRRRKRPRPAGTHHKKAVRSTRVSCECAMLITSHALARGLYATGPVRCYISYRSESAEASPSPVSESSRSVRRGSRSH